MSQQRIAGTLATACSSHSIVFWHRTGLLLAFVLPLLLLPLLLMLAACAPGARRMDLETAQALAAPARLDARLRRSGQFVLTTRERIEQPGSDVTIYIEGDGFAWATRTLPSNDPTPDNPVALALAALDPAPNVAWIARPCQYTPRTENPLCALYYWTHGRLAPEVVQSVDAAVTAIKVAARAPRVHLVGYSGGGGLAVLVAATRTDVASIRTLAGNLEIEAFTRLHGVSAMTGSLNPAAHAKAVEHIPQQHWVGAADAVVPVAISRAYLAAMTSQNCARVTVLPGVSHYDGWPAVWRTLVPTLPACIPVSPRSPTIP